MQRFKEMFPYFFLLFSCLGCSPSTLSDLRFEAKKEMRSLGKELKALDDKESVQKHFKSLEKRFKKIAKLMILSKNFSSDEEGDMEEAEIVFVELARLYEIPGVQELIEEAQKEAVHLLDRTFSKEGL